MKAADGYSKTSHTSGFSSVATYDFTYTPLSVPTGVSVKKSEDYTNKVTVNWTDNGATCYWVYYNSTNDTSTATCDNRYVSSGKYGWEITLPSPGTYYFWVKAADGSKDNSPTSDFSSAATYTY